MRPLATAEDLSAWLPPGQADSLDAADTGRLIARASEVIAEHATTGWSLNTAGDPAVTEVADALRDATCAQIEQWLEVGEENDVAGYSRTTTIGTGGVNVSSLPSVLAPRARRILRLAGLNSAVAW